MSVTQPMLQIPKTSSTSDKMDPWVTKADPKNKIGLVKALTNAATTNNQYLSLFILTILPWIPGPASPITFLHFFLVVRASSGTVYPRSADKARVGDQHLPKYRYRYRNQSVIWAGPSNHTSHPIKMRLLTAYAHEKRLKGLPSSPTMNTQRRFLIVVDPDETIKHRGRIKSYVTTDDIPHAFSHMYTWPNQQALPHTTYCQTVPNNNCTDTADCHQTTTVQTTL
jgi:hypothetical protein